MNTSIKIYKTKIRLHAGKRIALGQGMIEFALTLPILLVLILGVIEFGRLLFVFSAVTTGAREAARYGSAAGITSGSLAQYRDCQGIRSAAKRLSNLAGIQDNDVLIQYDKGPGSGPPFGVCPVGGSGPASVGLKDRVIITVSGNFQPMAPLIDIPPFKIESTTRRTIVKGVEIK